MRLIVDKQSWKWLLELFLHHYVAHWNAGINFAQTLATQWNNHWPICRHKTSDPKPLVTRPLRDGKYCMYVLTYTVLVLVVWLQSSFIHSPFNHLVGGRNPSFKVLHCKVISPIFLQKCLTAFTNKHRTKWIHFVFFVLFVLETKLITQRSQLIIYCVYLQRPSELLHWFFSF